MVFVVKGPGLSSVAEAYRKLVPFKSVSSIKTMSVYVGHSVWKYLNPPGGTVVVTFPSGLMMAGAVKNNNI
jgi:hypothetical protein